MHSLTIKLPSITAHDYWSKRCSYGPVRGTDFAYPEPERPILFLPVVTYCFRSLLFYSMWLEGRSRENFKHKSWCSILDHQQQPGWWHDLGRTNLSSSPESTGKKAFSLLGLQTERIKNSDWGYSSFLAHGKSQSALRDRHMSQNPEDTVWNMNWAMPETLDIPIIWANQICYCLR